MPPEEQDPELLFQRYSHDKRLKGAASTDFGIKAAAKRVNLTPQTFHSYAKDLTVERELEKELEKLGEVLK